MGTKLGLGALVIAVSIILILFTAGNINDSFQTGQLTTETVTIRNETVDNATNTTRSYRTAHFNAPGFIGLNTSLFFYVNSTLITNVQMLANGSINVSNTSLNPSCGAYAAPNGRCSVNYTYTYTPHNSAYNISLGGNEFATNYSANVGIYGTILIAVLIVGILLTGFVLSKR